VARKTGIETSDEVESPSRHGQARWHWLRVDTWATGPHFAEEDPPGKQSSTRFEMLEAGVGSLLATSSASWSQQRFAVVDLAQVRAYLFRASSIGSPYGASMGSFGPAFLEGAVCHQTTSQTEPTYHYVSYY
jgi:hypothetical protein